MTAPPRLHTIYRSSPVESRKNRPPFYSKDLALRSFLEALSGIPEHDRLFVNDGQLPEPRNTLTREAGEIVQLDGVGNCRSYRACVSLAEIRPWRDDDWVYIVEDDYLHEPGAIRALIGAAAAIPHASYLTVYDHPDYYRLRRHRAFMAVARQSYRVDATEWRQVRSTCLTYAARVGALRRDAWLHYLCSRTAGAPSDYAIWATLTGWGVSFALPRILKPPSRPNSRRVARAWLRPSEHPPKVTICAARPGLATHLEEGMLGPDRDWAAIAAGFLE
jgi:hypothetical protein